jgi:hypothetical protein
MIHSSPRLLRICSKITVPILPYHETRTYLRELQIDDTSLIDGGFDGITFAILGEFHAAAVGVEVLHVFGEGVVGEVV